MWGIFVDNKPLCVLNRETGAVMPMLFESKEQPATIANTMNKELLNVDIAVRPVVVQTNKEPDYRFNGEYDGEGEQ